MNDEKEIQAGFQADLREFKRERVLDSALRLFYEKGYSNTTMEEVASSLDSTKPFIYRYFKNKEALLVAVYERVTDRVFGLLTSAIEADESPDRQLEIFLESFVRENMQSVMIGMVYMQEEKNLQPSYRASINERNKRFDNTLADLIQRGVEKGQFQAKDPKIAALAITGMVRWLQRWYKPTGRLSEDEISEMIVEAAMNSLKYRATARKRSGRPPRQII